MRRIILDTDLAMGAPGSEIDDGFALALALADPDLSVELLTTVNGNTDVESATLLSLELLDRLGAQDLRVVKGAGAPLTRPDRRGTPPDVTGDGRGATAQAVARQFGHRAPAPGYAAAEIARLVMANPGEITIVAIGPLTNVAVAMSLEPDLAANLREIVIMGGVFLGQTGDSVMSGEFNIWIDPESAEAVLYSGARIRWVGLDVTLQVRLTRDHARRMSAGTGSFGSFAGDATVGWIDHMAAEYPGQPDNGDSCAMHDPLAVAVVTHPELVTWTPAHVAVITGDGRSRGVMVTDLLKAADPPEPNCSIATAVDVDAFMEHFLTSITSL